jgi:propionyl-CoA carboxylase beta chain
MIAVIKRWLPTAALLVSGSALLLLTDQAGASRTLPAVAVLQQVSTAVLDAAVKGMLEGLAERGFVDAVVEPAETRAVIGHALAILVDKREHLQARPHDNTPL